MEYAQDILLDSTKDDIEENAQQIYTALYLLMAASLVSIGWIIFIEWKFIKQRNFFFELFFKLKMTADESSKEDIDHVASSYLGSLKDAEIGKIYENIKNASPTKYRHSQDKAKEAQSGIKLPSKNIDTTFINAEIVFSVLISIIYIFIFMLAFIILYVLQGSPEAKERMENQIETTK